MNTTSSSTYSVFAPKPIRILAIIQLCVSFMIVSYYALVPFVSNYFAKQSEIILIKTVMGKNELVSEDKKNQIESNSERFNNLSSDSQENLKKLLVQLKEGEGFSFSDSFSKMVHILVFQIPPLLQAWLFFSITIALMLLLKIEGASLSTVLPPLILLGVLVFDLKSDQKETLSFETLLFPSEATIVKNYLEEPLSGGAFNQQKQLVKGWKLFLVNAWANETPSTDEKIFENQVEKGDFLFTLSRIEALERDRTQIKKAEVDLPLPFILTVFLFLWSLFFSWKILKYQLRSK